MKTLLAALAFLATSAYAQFEDLSFRVAPNHGPVTGGTEVTLEGSFLFGLADPCVGASVSVGGRTTFTNNYSQSKVVFVTEPYTPGTFDVTVDTCGAKAMMKNAFTYGGPWERVLLPIYLYHDVAGAHGSVWRTDFTAINLRGGGTITGEPPNPSGALTSDEHVPGRILYLGNGADAPHATAFNLRIRDISREAENAGTELPVVREDNAYGPWELIVLPNIPVGARYRAKLRVYRIDLGDPVALHVDISGGGALLDSRDLALSAEPMTNGFLRYPSYAELDLDRISNIGSRDRVDVTIQTQAQGRYWAFVAVTNNETQQITTVTPQ